MFWNSFLRVFYSGLKVNNFPTILPPSKLKWNVQINFFLMWEKYDKKTLLVTGWRIITKKYFCCSLSSHVFIQLTADLISVQSWTYLQYQTYQMPRSSFFLEYGRHVAPCCASHDDPENSNAWFFLFLCSHDSYGFPLCDPSVPWVPFERLLTRSPGRRICTNIGS